MPYRPANTSVFGGGHPAGPAAGRPTYLGATTRARTEGQAAEDRRWVHDQLFVLNVTFAALMGLLLLGCGGGAALWLMVARSDLAAPPVGPVDTRREKK